MEFERFASIEILESLITISEKIHGTNAQIAISDDGKDIQAGSRERWVTPDDDNYGFATWVYANREELIRVLGPGRHFGEWYGSGIGPGYGLKEKRFALFNTHRWTGPFKEGKLLPRMDVVPILYQGTYTSTIVEDTMKKLSETGSQMVPGFPRPEGVVVFFHRTNSMFKQVFDKEDTGWDKREKKEKAPVDQEFEAKVLSYMHPVRLEKLMMREERFLREYPKTLPEICKAYVDDLVKESEPIDATLLGAIRKKSFQFVREVYGK